MKLLKCLQFEGVQCKHMSFSILYSTFPPCFRCFMITEMGMTEQLV